MRGFGELQRALDRLELGVDRPRLEERPGRPRRCLPGEPRHHLVALGVHGHRQPEPRRLAQAVEERRVVGAGKLGQARVAHERLEADHAFRGHFGHLGHGARHEPAPQAEVGNRRRFERRPLRVHLAAVHGARRGVERHVEEHRAAAGRQRAAAAGRAFPLGASRLVEMDVHVDHRGQHQEAAGVDLLAGPRQLRSDRGDAPIVDRDVGLAARPPA